MTKSLYVDIYEQLSDSPEASAKDALNKFKGDPVKAHKHAMFLANISKDRSPASYNKWIAAANIIDKGQSDKYSESREEFSKLDLSDTNHPFNKKGGRSDHLVKLGLLSKPSNPEEEFADKEYRPNFDLHNSEASQNIKFFNDTKNPLFSKEKADYWRRVKSRYKDIDLASSKAQAINKTIIVGKRFI